MTTDHGQPATADFEKFDSTSPESMAALKDRFSALPVESHGAIAARLLASGLIIAGDEYLKKMSMIASRLENDKGINRYEAWVLILSLEPPEISYGIVKAAQWAMENGECEGHPDIVGSFPQDEIDGLAQILADIERVVNDREPTKH